MERTSGILSSD